VTQALIAQLPIIDKQVSAFVSIVRRLATEWAVMVTYGPVPCDQVAVLDTETRTVILRRDTPVEDQMWALVDVWFLITFGPHAAPAARKRPHLQLVPAPRASE